MKTMLSGPAGSLDEQLRRHHVVEGLLANGWATMPSSLPTLGPGIFEGLGRLVCDPQRERWEITDKAEVYNGRIDLGLLVRKKGASKAKDGLRQIEEEEGRTQYTNNRILFNWNSRLPAYLLRNGANVGDYQVMLEHLDIVHRYGNHLGFLIAEEMDRQFPGFDFFERAVRGASGGKTKSFINCVDETKGYASEPVHRDRDLVSIRILASSRALKLWDRQGKLVDTDETDQSSLLFFLGSRVSAITRGKLLGTVHGVVNGTIFRVSTFNYVQCHLGEEDKLWANENGVEASPDSNLYPL